jgi:alkaline phosphatase D
MHSLLLIHLILCSYDSKTGKGSLAVEFAGTAVSSHSPLGEYILPFAADAVSKVLVTLNPDLQWSEAAYRGFFTLTITPEIINATYYAMSNVKTQNLDSFVASTFSVKKGTWLVLSMMPRLQWLIVFACRRE